MAVNIKRSQLGEMIYESARWKLAVSRFKTENKIASLHEQSERDAFRRLCDKIPAST